MASLPANDNEPLPGSRKEAKEVGSKWYFTGKPCPHGHIVPRMTTNGACRTCAYERTAAYLADKWKTSEEWRIEKVRKERERRHKPGIIDFEREKGARRAREKRAKDPEYAEETRRRCRIYYAEVRKYDPVYKAKKVVHHRTRRARKIGSEGTHTLEDIAEQLKRQKYKCAECGVSVRKKGSRHVDHIMPLSLGGTNWPWNIQILCPTCNLSKGAKHPLEWAKTRGRLI